MGAVSRAPASRWYFTLAALVIPIAVTLLFWAVLPARLAVNENDDYKTFYEPVARNILAGRGIVTASGLAAVRYPPGYPLLLAAAVGLSHALAIPEAVGLAVSTLVGAALGSVAIFFLARSVWGPIPALAASGVWATYPPALWLTKQPNSEVWHAAALYSGIWLLWSGLRRSPGATARVRLFLAGLAIGASMLIRPIAIGAGLCLAGMVWLMWRDLARRTRLTLVAMLLVGNLAAVFPWEAWVYWQTRRLVPLSEGGVPSMRDGLTFAVNLKGFRSRLDVPADVETVMRDIQGRYESLRSFRAIAAVLADQSRQHPLGVIELFAIKAARSWYGTDSHRLEHGVLLMQILYLLLLIGGGVAAWRSGGAAAQLVAIVWAVTLYCWLMDTLTLSVLRYMVPAIGLALAPVAALVPLPAAAPGPKTSTRPRRALSTEA